MKCAKAIGVSNSLIFDGTILIFSTYQKYLNVVKHGNCIAVKDIQLNSTLFLEILKILD
jgi:hypothetical protein